MMRFLHREQPEEPWRIFAYQKVTFGVQVAAVLLEAAKKRVSEVGKEVDPEAARLLVEASLVDDGCTGGTPEACRRMRGRRTAEGLYTGTVAQLLGVGGFRPKFMVHAKNCSEEEATSLDGKVLGIAYDAMGDTISFKFNCEIKSLFQPKGTKKKMEKLGDKELQEIQQGTRVLTRRQVLSFIMGQYDPLGLVSPLLIPGKLLLRESFRAKIAGGWDRDLEQDLKHKWVSYIRELLEMDPIYMDRATTPEIPEGSRAVCDIVGFWDGALPAYCLCVFTRWEITEPGKQTRVEVRLVFAKSRISPLNGTTAPRAELQALMSLTRALLLVLRALDHAVRWAIMMGDSECCIAAINKPATEMRPYFQNRISEYHSNTEMMSRHVEKVVGPWLLLSLGRMGMQQLPNLATPLTIWVL